MRKKLEAMGTTQRHRFTATFERFGTKNNYYGWPETTVLLVDVMDEEGNLVTDHLWFNFTKGFEKLDLKEGDKVTFCGRVTYYWKGYRGHRNPDYYYNEIEQDCKISYPTKIEKIE